MTTADIYDFQLFLQQTEENFLNVYFTIETNVHKRMAYSKITNLKYTRIKYDCKPK